MRSASSYPSQSEADLALVGMLTFYSPSNAQVRHMFRLSMLGKRAKASKDDRYVNLLLARARATHAPRLELNTRLAAAMAPYIDAEVAAYRAKWGAR